MNGANQRSALAALDQARPVVSRLDVARDPDDNAADLLESWRAVETALRALVGGSGLGGQALIRELRAREVITLDAAHSLLEFLAARDRANSASYRPTASDVAAARDAVQKLETGLMAASYGAPAGGLAAAAPPVVAAPAATGPEPAASAHVPRRSLNTRVRGVPAWAILVVMLVALAGLGALAWRQFSTGGEPAAYREGVQEYAAGRREAARASFEKAIRDDPNHAPSHVYLGRVAREQGDMATASRELQAAIRLDPGSATAQREMGSFLLANNNANLAKNFYVRALGIDPSDRSAMGFLGCALTRIGRPDEAQKWYARAGQGPWSACAAARPMLPNGPPPGSVSNPGLTSPYAPPYPAPYPPGAQPVPQYPAQPAPQRIP